MGSLPDIKEEIEPRFEHYPAESLPVFKSDGIWGKVILGSAYGMTSEVNTYSPLFYVHLQMSSGSVIRLPDEYSERAAYIVRGKVFVDGKAYLPGQMLVFTKKEEALINALEDSVLMLLGGESVGERYIWWNFVASTKERIAQARKDWQDGRFILPPNDNKEFIPLPER